MPQGTRCVPHKRAVKFFGVCVRVYECASILCLAVKILRPYFDFIKAFVHITGQDTFYDNKIYAYIYIFIFLANGWH